MIFTVNIIHFYIGDRLELKKNHPCGSRTFEVLRVGSQVRIRCIGCGHDMVLDRIKLEKAIKKVHPASAPATENKSEKTE